MTCVSIFGSKAELTQHVPGKLSQLQFKDLRPGLDLSKHVIQGEVCTKWPLQKSNKNSLLKLALKEDDSQQKVNVYLVGDVAEKLTQISNGDVLALSGVHVENVTSSTTSTSLQCQIVVDEARCLASVWAAMRAKPQDGNTNYNQRKGKAQTYTYTNLDTVKAGTTVNVVAVVKYYKSPTKTRGSDYYMMLSLKDPSLDQPHEKLKCMIFAREMDKLPPVKKFGEIVVMHRLKVQEFRDELQGQAGPGFSCLVFDGAEDASLTPRTCSQSYTFTEQALERVVELRTWYNQSDVVVISQPTSPKPSSYSLSQFVLGKYYDITCQVIATCILKSDTVLLRVWDGTRVYQPIYEEDTRKDEYQKRLKVDSALMRRARGYMVDVFVFDDHYPTAASVKPGDFVRFRNLHAARYKDPNHPEISSQVPTIELDLHRGTSYGRGLSVLPPDSDSVMELRLRLREMEVDESDSSLLMNSLLDSDQGEEFVEDDSLLTPCFVIKRKVRTKKPELTVAADTSESAQTDQLNISDVNSSEERRCLQRTATVITAHHHIQRTRLADVIEGAVPNKYRIKAQVLDYSPKASNVKDFLRLYCPTCHFLSKLPLSDNRVNTDKKTDRNESWRYSVKPYEVHHGIPQYSCPGCSKTHSDDPGTSSGHTLHYIYMLQMIMDDGTAWITTQLWKQEAIKFFYDITAADLLKDTSLFDRLNSKLQHMCPTRGKGDRPWVECCIIAHTTPSGVCYQLFDTALGIEE